MSYDLDVYGKVSLTSRELAKVASSAGADARRGRGWAAKSVTVLDDSQNPAFTVEGPFRVEPDDLPRGVSEILGSKMVYNIHVPYIVDLAGGGFRAVPDSLHLAAARAYAVNLAGRVEGTVVDPQIHQSGDPQPASADENAAPTPELYLHLEWFRRLDGSPESKALAAAYLRAAKAVLPVAVPARFGPSEPLRGRLPRDGDDVFDDTYRTECRLSTLVMTSKTFSSGSISPWSSITSSGYQTASVVFALSALEKSGSLDRVQGFVAEMARQSGSFFAFAEVNSNRYTTARPRGFDGAWGGLPTDPQWITWYNTEYAALVVPQLLAGSTETYAEGTIHRWSDKPTSSEEIRRFAGRDPWVSADLRGAVEVTANGVRGTVPAKVLPASLRSSPPDPD